LVLHSMAMFLCAATPAMDCCGTQGTSCITEDIGQWQLREMTVPDPPGTEVVEGGLGLNSGGQRPFNAANSGPTPRSPSRLVDGDVLLSAGYSEDGYPDESRHSWITTITEGCVCASDAFVCGLGGDAGLQDTCFRGDDPSIDVSQPAVAEKDDVAWLNYIARVMWPFMRKAIMKRAGKMFRERMGEELGKHPEIKLTELKFDFDPGMTPPELNGMRVHYSSQQEQEAVKVDSAFSWCVHKDFHLEFTIIGCVKKGAVEIPIKAEHVGISELNIGGTLSCLLSPLLDYEPVVGTGQAFFLDTPSIEMKLAGLSRLGSIGGLIANIMEGVISNVLADGYILPHRFTQKVRKDLPLETMINCKSPLPLGVLQVEVLEARNVKAADVSITGHKKSDPFVEVKIGYDKIRTSTVAGTLNPVWKDPPGHLFVYNVMQIVRITVHDDDLYGHDMLGQVLGYSVHSLVHECMGSEDGVWLDVEDFAEPEKSAGMLRVRVGYYDVADLGQFPLGSPQSKGSASKSPPYLLTVKLVGLEGEERGDMRETRCTVEQIVPKQLEPGPEDSSPGSAASRGSVDKSEVERKDTHHSNRLMAGFHAAQDFAAKSATLVKDKAHSHLGLGFGRREDGVPSKRKTGKAQQWGAHAHAAIHDSAQETVPPMAIQAMEKLSVEENWSARQIAETFGMDEKTAKTAIDLRTNFQVIWCEAVHFLQPSNDPYAGKIKVSAYAPARQQVRGADDHGFIGTLEFNLAPTDKDLDEKPWRRRVRAELCRPKRRATRNRRASSTSPTPAGKGGTKKASLRVYRGSASAESIDDIENKVEEESSGILLEMIVELRALAPDDCQLEPGQHQRSKEELVEATKNSGVRITKV